MNSANFEKRYFLLPRAGIGHLRFILESYDGLAFARTLDRQDGLVEIAFPASRSADVDMLLEALAVEVGLQEVPVPKQVSPL
jgi:hypothetical protein